MKNNVKLGVLSALVAGICCGAPLLVVLAWAWVPLLAWGSTGALVAAAGAIIIGALLLFRRGVKIKGK